MVSLGLKSRVCLPVALFSACCSLPAQRTEPVSPLNISGQITVDGRSIPYLIRHLPVSSFPNLPAQLTVQLNRRNCLIPQSYEAHHPENVIHASLERPGSSDWAVLCSEGGTVTLLVYLSSVPANLFVLAAAPETERLQVHDASGALGFNPATPEQIRSAQIGLPHRPALLDHDALADSLLDHRTIYRYYLKNTWTVLEMPH